MNIYRFKKLLRNHFENGFSFYFILFLIFIFGIIIGALFIKAFDTSTHTTMIKYSSPYFYNYFHEYGSNYSIFKVSILYNLVYVFLSFVIGLVNLGLIVPLLVLIKGGALGFNVGYLIYNFGWRGFIISVLGFYPQYLIYIPCIIAIGALAMSVSFKYKFSSTRKLLKVRRLDIFDYTILSIFFTLVLIIGSVYEGFVSPLFLDLIKELL